MASQTIAEKKGISQRTIAILVVATVMIVIVGLNVNANRIIPAISSADHTNAQLVAEGRMVYQVRCASCHGANLEGQINWQTPLSDGSMPAPPHDATGHTWHHNDRFLFETVKYGGQATSPSEQLNKMPAFQGVLNDREIWATLAFIKSTWMQELIDRQKSGHN